MTTHRYFPGKCDYNGSGRRNCLAEITWSLHDGRFSMQAGIWNPRRTDYYCCGQAIETVAGYFPADSKLQRMAEIWRRWHLNDMRAGSPAQEDWLRSNPVPPSEYAYPKSYYEVVSAKLAEAGLNPDADGYRYGHAWKREEIPADVVAEIEGWSA